MSDRLHNGTGVTDAEWQTLRHYVHNSKPSKGRPPQNHRLVMDGVFWIAETGAAWRNLPEVYGKWGSVYRQFLRWSRNSVWDDAIDDLSSGITNGTGEFDPSDNAHELTEEQRLALLRRLERVRAVASRPRSAQKVGVSYRSESRAHI